MPVVDEKRALRDEMRQRRAALVGPERDTANMRLTEQLTLSSEWAAAATVMLFVGVKTEPDTSTLRTLAAAEGRTVILPRVVGDDLVALPDTGRFEVSPFGIPEPCGGDVFDPDAIDLVIVPGLAFDAAGFRLGYGAGFYDRFLPTTRARTVGIGFDFQIVAAVPRDDHDVALDGVVTDQRRLR